MSMLRFLRSMDAWEWFFLLCILACTALPVVMILGPVLEELLEMVE